MQIVCSSYSLFKEGKKTRVSFDTNILVLIHGEVVHTILCARFANYCVQSRPTSFI